MALGDLAGRCKASLSRPTAQGECDQCGVWYPLDRLGKQFQWQGAALVWTGFLKCPRCLDVPQEQFKVLILPPDPKPRVNPRPSHDITQPHVLGQTPPTSPENQGFTRYLLGGGSIPPFYPTDKQTVLADILALSGLPVPGTILDQSVTLTQGVPVAVMPVNPLRSWVLLYNPTQQPCEFALGSPQAAWNGTLNLPIGPGEAYFWATAQGLGVPYQGPISAIGQYSGAPLWAWDTLSGGLGNDNGVLYIIYPPASYPLYSPSLPPGSVYLVQNFPPSYANVIGIVPGVIPNPSAPPVYFGTVTSNQLLAMGGGNLPMLLPTPGSLQLWNNGDLVCVA